MRKLFGTLIALALAAGSAFADSNAQIYNAANALYQAGDYAGALAKYEAITVSHPWLEYNKGAANLKLGKIGKSVVHFHRALRLDPGDEDALANLAYVNSIKADSELKQKPGKLESAILWIEEAFHLNGMFWMFTSLYYIAAILAGAGMLANNPMRGKKLYTAAIAVMVAATFWGGVTVLRISEFERGGEAVAIEPTVDAFMEPSENSDKLFTFHEGSTCRVNRAENGFAQITLSSGLTGWVKYSALEKI